MATNTSKTEMLAVLRSLVKDMLQLRTEGVAQGKFARAHGYVDGYIRVMLDAGLASERELLDVVLEERRRGAGSAPAVNDSLPLDMPQVA
jgi:hypothetical protein